MLNQEEQSVTEARNEHALPPRLTLPRLLSSAYTRFSDKTALRGSSGGLSFAELALRANRLAAWLASAGCDLGSRVVIVSRNSVEHVIADHGVLLSGCVRVAVAPNHSVAEVEYIIRDCRPAVVMLDEHWESHREVVTANLDYSPAIVSLEASSDGGLIALSEIVHDSGLGSSCTRWEALDSDSPAYINYTSGSTGQPKGAIASQGCMAGMVRNLAVAVPDLSLEKRVLHVAPIAHFSGVVMLASISFGGTQFLEARLDAGGMLERVEGLGIEILPMVPTLIRRLIAAQREARRDVSSLTCVPYTASRIESSVLEDAIDVFGPVFVQFYGSSEALPPIAVLSKQDHWLGVHSPHRRELLNTCGQVLPFTEVAIMRDDRTFAPKGEVGEIVVRSDTMMQGYWGMRERTLEVFSHGWLLTGDVGFLSEDNYLSILDRRSDMIITGGFNVYPKEVEQVVMSVSGVQACVVFGVSSEDWGEKIVVLVIPESEQATETELGARIRDACIERLANYKVPKTIAFVEEFPSNAVGKVSRRDVRDWALLSDRIR